MSFVQSVLFYHRFYFQVMSEVKSEFGGDGSHDMIFLPQVIWTQLRLGLQPLLAYRTGVDQSLVLQWSHRRLREVAETRYLPQDNSQVSITNT